MFYEFWKRLRTLEKGLIDQYSRIVKSINKAERWLRQLSTDTRPFFDDLQVLSQILRDYPDHFKCVIANYLLERGSLEPDDEFFQEVSITPHADLNAVLIPLWEEKWLTEKEPLKFLAKIAGNLETTAQHAAGIRPPSLKKRKIFSIDAPSPTGDPYAALLPAKSNLDPVEIRIVFEEAADKVGFSPDQKTLLRARLDGVTRAEASEFLGWPPKKVGCVWRSQNRAFPRFMKAL